MWQCWGLIIISITIFAILDCVESHAKSCYFGPPPQPDPNNPDSHHWMKEAMKEVRKNCPGRKTPKADSCTPNPCQEGGTCRLQFQDYLCDYRASCQALKEAGATGYGYIYIKPPCDPSIAPVKVWCNQDSYDGGWMWLYYARTVKCHYTNTWIGGHISCSEPDNMIGAFAVTDADYLRDTVNMWFLNNSFCQPLSINRDFAADLANCRGDGSTGLGDADVLIEGVCSTEASWGSGTFAGCGTSMDVRVNVSVHFDSSPYGTYVMACYDGSTWLNLESWDMNDNYRGVWIKN